MYYSSEARVFIELVTLNDTVEELMWQRYDPNSSSFAELDFAAASEVSITGKQFSATTTKLETKKQEAEQATPRQRKPNGQQDGTDQPATAPESQAEDSDKSQTEAEGRSR